MTASHQLCNLADSIAQLETFSSEPTRCIQPAVSIDGREENLVGAEFDLVQSSQQFVQIKLGE